jgi:hypothetical protein
MRFLVRTSTARLVLAAVRRVIWDHDQRPRDESTRTCVVSAVGAAVAMGLRNANHGANNREDSSHYPGKVMKTANVAPVLVALNVAKGVHNVIAQAKTIVAEMAANPSHFPAPNPALATVTAHITALEAADTVALTRAKGAVEARNIALRVLLSDLHTLKAYVQQVANADPTNAEAIITASTMSIRKAPVRKKTDFKATPGAVSGTVKLVARSAGQRASYDWQWSLDQKSWTDLPPSLQAHTSVPNLSVGVTHYFRYRAVTKAGPGDWSQTVSLLVS